MVTVTENNNAHARFIEKMRMRIIKMLNAHHSVTCSLQTATICRVSGCASFAGHSFVSATNTEELVS